LLSKTPPILHAHDDVDWSGYVLEGEIALDADDDHLRIPTGGYVLLPRHTAFRWWNARDDMPVRWLITYTPGGFEQFFRDLDAKLAALGRMPTPEDMQRIAPALWSEYRVQVVKH